MKVLVVSEKRFCLWKLGVGKHGGSSVEIDFHTDFSMSTDLGRSRSQPMCCCVRKGWEASLIL